MAQSQQLKSPAELVAIARAAHIVGDRDLERSAKHELLEQFGIEIKFQRARMADARPEGAAR